jgi:hypothetical protein
MTLGLPTEEGRPTDSYAAPPEPNLGREAVERKRKRKTDIFF